MKQTLPLVTLVIATTAAGPASAFDPAAGKQLVDGNCYSCHGSEIYTRADRMVKSRSGLTTQVQRCELALGLSWFDEDVDNAAEYLNQKFYHFAK
ncbi:MAG: cytochrome c [Gammaproteobacteria bacterium]|nr:cytochrome c [Gammaproteobacteria bacterium]